MYLPIVHRVAKSLRAGTSVGIAGADGSGVLRKGCAQGGSIITAFTTGACVGDVSVERLLGDMVGALRPT